MYHNLNISTPSIPRIHRDHIIEIIMGTGKRTMGKNPPKPVKILQAIITLAILIKAQC